MERPAGSSYQLLDQDNATAAAARLPWYYLTHKYIPRPGCELQRMLDWWTNKNNENWGIIVGRLNCMRRSVCAIAIGNLSLSYCVEAGQVACPERVNWYEHKVLCGMAEGVDTIFHYLIFMFLRGLFSLLLNNQFLVQQRLEITCQQNLNLYDLAYIFRRVKPTSIRFPSHTKPC